jgi:hypothetical protein
MEMSPSNQQQGLEKGNAARRQPNAPEIIRDISSGLLTENEAATEIFLAGNFFWAAGRGARDLSRGGSPSEPGRKAAGVG